MTFLQRISRIFLPAEPSDPVLPLLSAVAIEAERIASCGRLLRTPGTLSVTISQNGEDGASAKFPEKGPHAYPDRTFEKDQTPRASSKLHQKEIIVGAETRLDFECAENLRLAAAAIPREARLALLPLTIRFRPGVAVVLFQGGRRPVAIRAPGDMLPSDRDLRDLEISPKNRENALSELSVLAAEIKDGETITAVDSLAPPPETAHERVAFVEALGPSRLALAEALYGSIRPKVRIDHLGLDDDEEDEEEEAKLRWTVRLSRDGDAATAVLRVRHAEDRPIPKTSEDHDGDFGILDGLIAVVPVSLQPKTAVRTRRPT
jgi:hypothetical protein